jgi:CheY-like chemotaxis protein
MGGRAWAESKVGAGSTFHFTARFAAGMDYETRAEDLNQQRSDAGIACAVARVASASLNGQTANGLRDAAQDMRPLQILLVDDSVDNRFLLKAFLKRYPYRLDEAENGLLAVEKFTSGRYDLVLMDMQMPVMDGYTAVRTIREWERERNVAATPIIALTASALREDVAKCIAAGCDLHVSKPVNKTTLLDALRRSLANDDVRSPPPNDQPDPRL